MDFIKNNLIALLIIVAFLVAFVYLVMNNQGCAAFALLFVMSGLNIKIRVS